MAVLARFEELLAEGDAQPVAGWDLSWFDGRATEQRPPWGYAGMLTERMSLAAEHRAGQPEPEPTRRPGCPGRG